MHAFSKDPEHITKEADIVVAAAGVPNLVRGSWLKPGAVVIDVGTCPVEVKKKKKTNSATENLRLEPK